MSASSATKTNLRKRLERACGFDAAAQLRDCVEYLEHPEILVAEFSDAFLTAEAFDNREEDFCAFGQAQIPKRRWADHVVQKLIEAGGVGVGQDYAFRYLAREIIPLWTTDQKQHSDARDRRAGSGGIDYVGLIEEEEPKAVLGIVQPCEHDSPYLSLLRLLSCLAEVATESQMERANRFLFKGALSFPPTFDLHILQVGFEAEEEHKALGFLTRDLAHAFNRGLKEEWQFPNLLRHIYCLGMREDADGRQLEVLWRV